METLLLAFDLLGTFVFALSGGVLAVRKRLDLFGVLVLSCAAVVSGGIVRDLLVVRTPVVLQQTELYAMAALAGCDRLTISPELLDALAQSDAGVERALVDAGQQATPGAALGEAAFRWQHNEDAMATEKLAEGIRKFAIDQGKLEALLAAKLG